MKNNKLKPKRTIKESSKIILFLVGLLCLLLVFMLVKDILRHKKVVSAIDKTQAALNQQGFGDLTRSSGCGRTQAKYGKGAQVCTIVLSASTDFIKQPEVHDKEIVLEAVNEKVASFYKAIESTGLYERRSSRPTISLLSGVFDFDSSVYRLKNAELTSCGSTVDFDWRTFNLKLSFYCRDTSWFDRTFRNGRYSF